MASRFFTIPYCISPRSCLRCHNAFMQQRRFLADIIQLLEQDCYGLIRGNTSGQIYTIYPHHHLTIGNERENTTVRVELNIRVWTPSLFGSACIHPDRNTLFEVAYHALSGGYHEIKNLGSRITCSVVPACRVHIDRDSQGEGDTSCRCCRSITHVKPLTE